MPQHRIGYQPSSDSDSNSVLGNVVAFNTILRDRHHAVGGEDELCSQCDQVAREVAEIELAAALLRKAEPTLQIWTAASSDPLVGTPHSVWRSIGLVWISSVLITAGALLTIAQLAGQAAHRFVGG